MHSFPFIFIPLHSYNSSIPLLYEHCHADSPHFHPDSPHSQLDFPHSHPHSPHSHPDSLHSHPDSPHSISCFQHSHPDSPHCNHSYPDFPHSHHSPHFVSRFPIPAFTDSLTFGNCFFLVIVIRTFLIRHVNKLSLHNTSF